MRGYIQWLMARYETLPEELSQRYEALLQEALERVQGAHARIPPVVAYLMLGLETFLDYTIEGGMLSKKSKPTVLESWWEAVLANTNKQVTEMADDKPTRLFCDTLRELLDSGRAVVERLQDRGGTAAAGTIGSFDKDYYYFNPGLTFGAVQRALNEQGTSFPLGKNMTLKQLADEGLILRDPGSGKNVRQLNRGGVRAWVMWMPRSVLDRQEQTQLEFTPEGSEEE